MSDILLDFYDPEKGEVIQTSQSSADLVNSSRRSDINFVNTYTNWPQNTKDTWDMTYPHYWDKTGKPNDSNFKAPAELIPISSPHRQTGISKGTPPTKININTGSGVPGGFSASSMKSPSAELAKIASTIASITSKTLAINAAISKGIPGVSLLSLKTLKNLSESALTKLSISAKAPDFSKTVVVPSVPSESTSPDFKSLGIPDVPAAPEPDTPKTISGVDVSSLSGFSNK